MRFFEDVDQLSRRYVTLQKKWNRRCLWFQPFELASVCGHFIHWFFSFSSSSPPPSSSSLFSSAAVPPPPPPPPARSFRPHIPGPRPIATPPPPPPSPQAFVKFEHLMTGCFAIFVLVCQNQTVDDVLSSTGLRFRMENLSCLSPETKDADCCRISPVREPMYWASAKTVIFSL